jgi:phthalate 4,5-dioxygenase
MLSEEKNQLLTRTGPGTKGGALLRTQWQPLALSADLPLGGPPLPVQVLSEQLVLYRGDEGAVGLLGQFCPHRGADLSYGRIEKAGLRCIYHGWLYSPEGRCLEQPNELPENSFAAKVRHTAYPCQEAGGIIFAYLGEGAAPPIPHYEGFSIPEEHRFTWRFPVQCNYLQGLEGNVDPSHLSFLHRALNPDMEYDVATVRGSTGAKGARALDLYSGNASPRLEVEETDFGFRLYTMRPAQDGKTYLRISSIVVPNLAIVAGETGDDGQLMLWHVPTDDFNHYMYALNFRRSGPIGDRLANEYRSEFRPDGGRLRTKDNRYLQDRESMDTSWFSGMGRCFPIHDVVITESLGPIMDRRREHLGPADKGVIALRALLLRRIDGLDRSRLPPTQEDHEKSAPLEARVVARSMLVNEGTDWRQFAA